MAPNATPSATRFAQTATPTRAPEALRTVAVLISDLAARGRVEAALLEEGLMARIVTTKDFTVRGLAGPPVAALVYDLAPWTDAARRFVRSLRGFPTAVPDVPLLLYVPLRAEAAQLLVEAGRLSMVWGELQLDVIDEVRRLRHAIRQVLAVTPAAVVFRLLMFHLPDLPSDVVQFCRLASGRLAAGKGGSLTVSALAKSLSVERRTLERRWRQFGLAPKELLDWIVLAFAAYVADRHNLEIDETGEILGLDTKRVQRCRIRLKQPSRTESVNAVLMQMSRRFSRIRVPHPRPEWDLRGEVVPLYEATGL